MKYALTMLVAIVMAGFGWFVPPIGTSAMDLKEPYSVAWFSAVVFWSCVIWLAAPSILRQRGSGSWVCYGLASPIVGAALAALTVSPVVALGFLPVSLLVLLFVGFITAPVGLLTAFIVHLIWRRPDWERPEKSVDYQVAPPPVLKRKGRSNVDPLKRST